LLNDVFGKKLKNALLVRLTDPAFGDQSGNKLTGRNVEPKLAAALVSGVNLTSINSPSCHPSA
jgi:hypothetical protein